jgi:exodeoxyribonuclease-1
MQSIFWHDYETFGANPQKDRPCQFAGVRTDLDLNIIEEPVTFYCKPSEDFLPSPEACLITGITPQVAMREGEVEALFAEKINHIFSVPGTCVAGYNSIRFDDEVSRNLFYRNFIDPYEREWKSGNSRWDIIDVVRLVYVMKPDTLNWPLNDDGSVSFRLELLTKENGIEHLSAHDAMSDVYATIELARLIKERQPKLYDWVFMMRDKNKINDMFDFDTHLHSRLKDVRATLAKKAGVPHYHIFPNNTLEHFTRLRPSSVEAGMRIKGVGEVKAKKYLQAFIDEIHGK